MRGAVRGALLPVSLPALGKALCLDAAAAGPTLGGLLEELAAAGQVAGQLRGGASSWVPAVHARHQQDDLLSAFRCASLLQSAGISALGCRRGPDVVAHFTSELRTASQESPASCKGKTGRLHACETALISVCSPPLPPRPPPPPPHSPPARPARGQFAMTSSYWHVHRM